MPQPEYLSWSLVLLPAPDAQLFILQALDSAWRVHKLLEVTLPGAAPLDQVDVVLELINRALDELYEASA